MDKGNDLWIKELDAAKSSSQLVVASVYDGTYALLMLGVIVLLWFVAQHWKKQVLNLLVIVTIAVSGMGVYNMVNINKEIGKVKEQIALNSKMPEFHLSQKGKNVVVIMLDRAMGAYIPYLFQEKPELKEAFSGFTYYPNAISFGGFTNVGTPALFGGYEYTPMEMNKRSDETLMTKQNEALKVMPVLFDENDFEVTVCDPTYANYQWIPDLSIYDEYPDIDAYITKGKFSDQTAKERKIQNNKRRFFCYSIVKSVPLCFQELLYDQGNYNQSNSGSETNGIYSGQTLTGTAIADGLYDSFMDSYHVLDNLSEMTKIDQAEKDTFMFMTNDTTHDPMLLQTPDYVPAEHVDNTEYDMENKDRFTVNGVTLKMENDMQITHYHANMAALLKLGEWFDSLRENGVYDNTRIILVSDHGQPLAHADEFMLEDGNDRSFFNPLLMVKDFNSKEFTTSEVFMTNADVPTLAMKELIENPTNPFTGKKMDSTEKTAHEQYILLSYDWDTNVNNGKTFLPGRWYSVKEDMRDNKNWKLIKEEGVLKSE